MTTSSDIAAAVDLTGLPAEQALALGALTAELIASAEQRGYQRAVDILRDDERYRDWWSTLPPGSPDIYWHGPGRRSVPAEPDLEVSGPRVCRRWRTVPAHLYGRTRLTCTRIRSHWDIGLNWHQNRNTGWSWHDEQPPTRTWVCNGQLDDATPHGVTLTASYDTARTKGWRINLDRGRIDAMCPACARPDPATVALCRDLQRSVSR